MKKAQLNAVAILAAILYSVTVYEEDYVIVIKNNQFSPREMILPAGQKIEINVKNLDATPAEFESGDLNR